MRQMSRQSQIRSQPHARQHIVRQNGSNHVIYARRSVIVLRLNFQIAENHWSCSYFSLVLEVGLLPIYVFRVLLVIRNVFILCTTTPSVRNVACKKALHFRISTEPNLYILPAGAEIYVRTGFQLINLKSQKQHFATA